MWGLKNRHVPGERKRGREGERGRDGTHVSHHFRKAECHQKGESSHQKHGVADHILDAIRFQFLQNSEGKGGGGNEGEEGITRGGGGGGEMV